MLDFNRYQITLIIYISSFILGAEQCVVLGFILRWVDYFSIYRCFSGEATVNVLPGTPPESSRNKKGLPVGTRAYNMPDGPPGWPVLPESNKVTNLQEGAHAQQHPQRFHCSLTVQYSRARCQRAAASAIKTEASQVEMLLQTYLEKVHANLPTQTKQLLSPTHAGIWQICKLEAKRPGQCKYQKLCLGLSKDEAKRLTEKKKKSQGWEGVALILLSHQFFSQFVCQDLFGPGKGQFAYERLGLLLLALKLDS